MTAVDGEPALIDSVLARLRERVEAPDAARCESFVRQYYRWVPTEDLLGRDASDLYGAAMAHWRLAGQRRRGATAIRVYDPEPERDGWESPHTVIEIVSDDMPFVVDSVTMELNRAALAIHLTLHPVLLVRRDESGKLLEVLPAGAEDADATRESVLHIEVDRRDGADERHALEASIARVLAEVRAAVEDWTPMRERLRSVIDTLAASAPDAADLAESEESLRWLESNHFTFLGYQEYEIRDGALRPVAGSALGVLRVDAAAATADRDDAWAQAIADLPRLLVLTKASERSTVHRPSYLDYVGVKRLDADGRLVGEHRFLGLYTTVAYWERAQQIPILREKVEHVLELAGFVPDSHDRKALLEILEESRATSSSRSTRTNCSRSPCASSPSASASASACSFDGTGSSASCRASCSSRATASTRRTVSESGRCWARRSERRSTSGESCCRSPCSYGSTTSSARSSTGWHATGSTRSSSGSSL